MNKKIVASVVVILLLLAATSFLPAPVGLWVFKNAAELEAKVYGFNKVEVQIEEMKLSLYRNDKEDSQTIIMLHGYSADKEVWPRFARYFSSDYHVLIPDLPGHGDTGFKAEWDYSAPAQAERLVQLLDTLGIEKAHVIGNSMGGFIAAYFAKNYPKKTLSATFIDPAGVHSPKPSDMQKMMERGLNPFLIDSMDEFYEFYAMTMEKPPVLPGFVLNAVGETYIQRKNELATIFDGFYKAEHALDESLDTINVPVLVLWGEKDRLIHVSSLEVWLAGIEGAEGHIFKDIGHMPMVEIPRESAQRYREFLVSIGQSGLK